MSVQPSYSENSKYFDSKSKEPDGRQDQEFFAYRSRRMTDVFFLVVMILCLSILICLLIYCMHFGDIRRIINGYDDCGNMCGVDNTLSRDNSSECSGENLISRPYLLVEYSSIARIKEIRTCVENCTHREGYRLFLRKCIKDAEKVDTLHNLFLNIVEELHKFWLEIIYMCLVALGLSIALIILLRYCSGIIIWIIMISATITSLIGTIFLWVAYSVSNNVVQPQWIYPNSSSYYLGFAIIATIITIVLVLIVLVLRKRIKLLVQLFAEAGKALSSMPALIFEPIATFISLMVIMSLFIFFWLYIESAGHLTKRVPHFYVYDPDSTIIFTRWYNLFWMLWMVQFVYGCQHMVIAGAVGLWYFSSNEFNSRHPISRSAYNLLRYHLGSVALGSAIITIVQFIRAILKKVQKFTESQTGKCGQCCLWCCQCCLMVLENILKYLSRQAYIQVAIHSYSFCKGGKEGVRLLTSNALRVLVINSVGDFILLMGKMLVLISTLLCGIELIKNSEKKDTSRSTVVQMWVPLVIAGTFSYLVAHCFLSVYEMAIDTIFLCFCEDSEKNDGLSKPYYMSRSLMEFVGSSNKELLTHSDKRKDAWKEKNMHIATISGNLNS